MRKYAVPIPLIVLGKEKCKHKSDVKLNSARQRASSTLIKRLYIKWQIKAVIRAVIALCYFGEIDGAAL